MAANYTFLATWDASIELSLADSADPRSRRVVLGGPVDSNAARADGDEVNGWYFYKSHWYKVLKFELTWAEARQECLHEGGYLAQIESEAEQIFLADLVASEATTWQVFLGATDADFEDVWRLANAPEDDDLLGVGSGSTFVDGIGKYTLWSSPRVPATLPSLQHWPQVVG